MKQQQRMPNLYMLFGMVRRFQLSENYWRVVSMKNVRQILRSFPCKHLYAKIRILTCILMSIGTQCNSSWRSWVIWSLYFVLVRSHAAVCRAHWSLERRVSRCPYRWLLPQSRWGDIRAWMGFSAALSERILPSLPMLQAMVWIASSWSSFIILSKVSPILFLN
jgi:hypothetical protein